MGAPAQGADCLVLSIPEKVDVYNRKNAKIFPLKLWKAMEMRKNALFGIKKMHKPLDLFVYNSIK